MRIGLLQFNPGVGAFAANVARAKALLKDVGPLDLLVLPEMALTGYCFKNRDHIRPHAEPRLGRSFRVACELSRTVPSRMVLLGIPEVAADGKLYNSGMLVQGDQLLYSFRKKHLYQVDETWATEGSGFGFFEAPGLPSGGSLLRVAFGICMDLNPYRFQAPFDAYEFGNHCAQKDAHMVVVPMAWTKAEPSAGGPSDDLSSVKYWLTRLSPLLSSEKRTLFIAANRTGAEDDTSYQGSSCIVLIDHGQLTLLGKLGLEEGVLTVDVDNDLLSS